jgi:hypothetical protein
METMETTTASNTQKDVYESAVKNADDRVKEKTGMSALHWLTLGSIAASLAFYLSGKKNLAFFIGLWPPTFLALKSASQQSDQNRVQSASAGETSSVDEEI